MLTTLASISDCSSHLVCDGDTLRLELKSTQNTSNSASNWSEVDDFSL